MTKRHQHKFTYERTSPLTSHARRQGAAPRQDRTSQLSQTQDLDSAEKSRLVDSSGASGAGKGERTSTVRVECRVSTRPRESHATGHTNERAREAAVAVAKARAAKARAASVAPSSTSAAAPPAPGPSVAAPPPSIRVPDVASYSSAVDEASRSTVAEALALIGLSQYAEAMEEEGWDH